MEPEIKRGVIQHVVRSLLIIAFFSVFIFLSAGDWRWLGGWLYIGVILASFVIAGLMLIPTQPELLTRRGQAGEGTQGWDRLLAPLMAWSPLYIGVLSGLVFRSNGSDPAAPWLRAVAITVSLAGSFLLNFAMLHNPFFEATVRIQEDQEHMVAVDGPYRWVRHPGYLGAVIFSLPAPLILGVYWGFAGVAVMVIALLVRTALEDRFLIENLDGYEEFVETTRFRLLPGVW